MACNNIENIVKNCLSNSGGIYTFYYIDQDLVNSVTVDPATYTITAIDLDESMKKIEFKRNTGNYTEVDTIDLINGSSYTLQTITLMLHRRQALISRALKIAGEGQRYLAIIVGDANGSYWYFDYAQLTATGEGSGTAKADGSKYSVTFTAEANQLAYEVDPDIVPALLVIS